jgi:hypothetical protein
LTKQDANPQHIRRYAEEEATMGCAHLKAIAFAPAALFAFCLPYQAQELPTLQQGPA